MSDKCLGPSILSFGVKDYDEVYQKQKQLFHEIVECKKSGKDTSSKEKILIGEHFPVITIGRKGKEENIRLSKEILRDRGINCYHIERGGDVTYHGPGQIVLYPILDLDLYHLGVKAYVDSLEETVIRTLDIYGIKGERIEGATGIWIGKDTPYERKISAIGIKCNRFCTMHGISFNIKKDISGFSLINPCGFKDKGVTSLESELGQEIDIEEVKKEFLHIFLSLIFPFKKVLYFTEKL